MTLPRNLLACHRCGLIQLPPHASPPDAAPYTRCTCARCHAPIRTAARSPSAWPAALALAAFILYPVAMSLPVLELQKLGRSSASTIWSGVVRLYSDGHTVIGTIVLLCSIVIPLGKLAGIFALSTPRLRARLSRRHQSAVFAAIDWLGRWGMIDVLLVAILVAAVKLGDWVDVTPGPGIIAFAGVVVLSLLASFTFDPQSIWGTD
jgi:paraquat-inducible protein A